MRGRSAAGWAGAGRTYELPTEAQWEFACRAGSPGRWSFGDDASLLKDYAWYGLAEKTGPRDVGQKLANGFGLYDMHGNIQEWCFDWHESEFYRESPGVDPVCTDKERKTATGRVVRGGWWHRNPTSLRSAARSYGPMSYRQYGFRVVVVGDLNAKTPPIDVAKQEPLPPTHKNSIGMEFVIVPKGKSWLGGGKDKLGDREVEIPADFYLGKYEVTQEEWDEGDGGEPQPLLAQWRRQGRGEGHQRCGPEAISGGERDVGSMPVICGETEQAGEGDGLGLPVAEGGGMGVCLSGRPDVGQAG